jgi:RNA 3'-terminal phosphate cyclase (ATP)
MITVDGSYGEGGGQIVRTSLSLSMITGKAFTINNIRARRNKSGLLAQHLTALNASIEISNGKADGARKGSDAFIFEPGKVFGGDYRFSVGTAGSATLVLQTVLPPLLVADKESEIIIEGGTHNLAAPPYDYILHSFIPVVNTMGPEITMSIDRYGFYPAGGGKINVHIMPDKSFNAVDLKERGELKKQFAESLYSQLPSEIAEDEAEIIRKRLKLSLENASVKGGLFSWSGKYCADILSI